MFEVKTVVEISVVVEVGALLLEGADLDSAALEGAADDLPVKGQYVV